MSVATIRYSILCLIILFLSSCIKVGDFGIYWEKGTIDPALLGTWEQIAPEYKPIELASDKVRIDEKEGTYQIDPLEGEQNRRPRKAGTIIKPAAGPHAVAKVLRAGKYSFLMVAVEGSKNLIRYTLDDGVLDFYAVEPDQMAEFLKRTYPKPTNIQQQDCNGTPSRCGYIEIETLDDEVYRVLSEIPDTREFWGTPIQQWRKLP